MRELLQTLSAAEDERSWGGAENVGDPPRGRGSALHPVEVERIVNGVLARRTR